MPAVSRRVSDASPARRTAGRALYALNFFMADMQAGIGPFLGVFLLARHWGTAAIGTAMTLGGIAGMAATIPAGIAVDGTTHKRGFIVIASIFTVLASGLLWLSQSFWMVTVSQIATAIAGAAIGPAVAGLTLRIVRQKGFNRQNGFKQAFNPAGNLAGAALSGFLGWKFGFVAVFWLAALFSAAAIASVLLIPKTSIDDRAARGMKTEAGGDGATGLGVRAGVPPPAGAGRGAGAVSSGQRGDAAALRHGGGRGASGKPGDLCRRKTIVVAQAVMVVTSFIAMRMGRKARLLAW